MLAQERKREGLEFHGTCQQGASKAAMSEIDSLSMSTTCNQYLTLIHGLMQYKCRDTIGIAALFSMGYAGGNTQDANSPGRFLIVCTQCSGAVQMQMYHWKCCPDLDWRNWAGRRCCARCAKVDLLYDYQALAFYIQPEPYRLQSILCSDAV